MSLPTCPKCGTKMEMKANDVSKMLTLQGLKTGFTAGHFLPGVGHVVGAIGGALAGLTADLITVGNDKHIKGRDKFVCPNCHYEIVD